MEQARSIAVAFALSAATVFVGAQPFTRIPTQIKPAPRVRAQAAAQPSLAATS